MRGIVTKKGNQNIGPAETMSRSSQRTWGDGALPAGVLARPAGSSGRGLWVEEGTANLFTAPEAAGTLPTTKTLAAGTYAVSAYGGGSIDVTGADATVCAGPDGADCKTFTLAAQTDVTFAANGAVSKCQLEAKAYATTYQDPALGARAAELLTLPTYVPATAAELASYKAGINLLTAEQSAGASPFTLTLPADTYTCSIAVNTNTGSYTLSGDATGTVVYGTPATFTLAAPGSITFTKTGTVNNLMLEPGNRAGSWVPGGQKRLLDATQGTIVMDVLVHGNEVFRQALFVSYYIRGFETGRVSFEIYQHVPGNWRFTSYADDGASNGFYPTPPAPGWRRIALVWTAELAKIYIDGISKETWQVANPKIVSKLLDHCYILSHPDYTPFNTVCDNIAVYTAAMPADWCSANGKPGTIPPANEHCTIRRTFDAARQVSRVGGRR